MNGLFEGLTGERLRKAIFTAVILFCAFLAVTILAGLRGLNYIGAGMQASNTISVSGHGEIFAVPDTATFSFSVVSDKATVAEAQAEATTKANAVTAYLKEQGVDEKDIKTTDYSVYPQYDYQQSACPTSGYCPPGRQVLRGYEVRQTTTVKVRDTKKAGDLLAGVGGKGATEVSQLNFTFDDQDKVQNDARAKAIADAKTKADTLAKQLGVSIVRVVSFNESGYNPYVGYAYGKGAAMDSAVAPQAAPEISVGQNKVTNDVTVVYEIR